MKFKDEIFSPYIFLIGFIIFCIIGLLGRYYFVEYFNPDISVYTLFYIILITLVFILGSKINIKINENLMIGLILFLIILFSFKRYNYYSIILLLLGLLIISMIKKDIFSKYYKQIFGIGVLLCILNIGIIGKIPLINPTIRESYLTPLFALGYSFILISNNFGLLKEKYPNKMIFPILSLFLFILYGFRTYIVILVISTMATFYLIGNKQKTILNNKIAIITSAFTKRYMYIKMFGFIFCAVF